jgi:hypothetical protein
MDRLKNLGGGRLPEPQLPPGAGGPQLPGLGGPAPNPNALPGLGGGLPQGFNPFKKP